MIDKKTEFVLKEVRGFLEFWTKFHSIYDGIIAKDRISEEDEKKFLEAKENIKGKYEELCKSLDFKYMPHSRLTDPVNDILGLGGIRFISEKNLKKLEDDWMDSYIFLNSIQEHFKSKKRRFEQFNPARVFFKRIFKR